MSNSQKTDRSNTLQGTNVSNLDRVFNFIKAGEGQSFSPAFIAEKTHIDHSTVRGIIKKLYDSHRITRPMKGNYAVCVERDGVSIENIKIENVVFSYAPNEPLIQISDEEHIDLALYDLQILYGATNNLVTGYLHKKGKALGLNPDTHILDPFHLSNIIIIFRQAIENKYAINLAPAEVEVKNIEFFQDFLSAKMEGCNCLTLTSYHDFLLKYYNKGNPERLRMELRHSQHIPASELLDTMVNGFVNVDLRAKFLELDSTLRNQNKELQEHKRTINWMNKRWVGLEKKMDRLYDILSTFKDVKEFAQGDKT